MADETLNIIIKQSSKGDGAQKAAQGLGGIDKAIQVAITAFAALKGAQAAVDFIEFGAGVERQTAALDGLAKSAGTSGDAIVKAIQGASDFTIDRMTAMSAASKAMILDVAETPEQFERLTKVATSLGRAMGQDAAKSIDDFVVAAGRQSRMIADNLGLMVSAGTAQERYAQKLGKTVGELTDAENKQAFLNEMLVQGEAKMAALSGATGDAATKLEQFNALAKDVKAAVAEELAVSVVDLAGDTATLVANLRDFIDTAGKATRFVVDATDAVAGWSSVMKVFNFLLDDHTEELDRSEMAAQHYVDELGRGAEMNRRLAEAQAAQERETQKQRIAQARIPIVVRDTVASYDEYQARLGRMPRDQETSTAAIYESIAAFNEQTIATQNATLAQMALSVQLADASAQTVASAAMMDLKAKLDEGKISFDDYKAAVTETQLAFGLATPESIALSEGVLGLGEALAGGKLKAEDYAEALDKLIGESSRAVMISNRLRDALNGIPRNIKVSIDVQERIAGREGNLPTPGQQRQYGGYVMTRQAVLVGEEGPELAVFPPGTEIYSAGNTTQMIQRAAGYGGDFRSSRGTVSLPGPLRPAPDTYGGGLGLGGGTVVQNTWYQTFVIKGDQDAALLAQEIKRLERMEGDRPEMGRMF